MPSGTSVAGNLSLVTTGGATISVQTGQTLGVGTLTLAGLGRHNGTWGSTSSTATYKNDTYFAATTGRLNVSTDTRTTPIVTTAPTASAITNGQALSASFLTLGAATNVLGDTLSGTFAFTSPGTIPNAGTTNAPVTFTPDDTGTYQTAATSASVDVIDRSMSVLFAGNGLVVTNNGAPAWDEGTFFGTVEIDHALTNTFAITNSSAVWPLTIWAVTTNGPDAALFQVEGIPATVDPGGSSNFTIAFTATNVGLYAATIAITNNSIDAPLYLINVLGAGPLLAPLANAATGITGTAFFANWDASPGATNYFLDVATTGAFGAGDFIAGYSNDAVGAVTTHLVSGLLGHRTYYYRVRAQGTTGTSSNLNVISVDVPENPPVANADSPTIQEDSGPVVINVLTNDTDADADSLLIVGVTQGAGTVTVNPGNTNITYTPGPDWNGTDTFLYVVVDGQPGGFAVGVVTVKVNQVNDMPSFTKGANQTVNEDCGLQTVAGWATAISAGPADESAQVLTFIVSNDNNGLFSVQPAVATNGTLTYTPAPDSNGTATVSVWLTDDGTAGGGALTTAVQTFTITVNPVNDSPIAVADVAFTPEDTPVVINVLTNDTDVDGDTLRIFSVTQGANGTVVINPGPTSSPGNTSVTYRPAADWSGTDTFSYVETDQAGGFATGTVTVVVGPVNDVPSFTKGASLTNSEDCGAQTVAGWATAISAGAANESAQVLTFIVTNSNNGLFSVQPAVATNGTLTYTPAPDSNGTATVSVSLTDDATAGGAALTSAVQTFTITVNPVNDMPSFTKGADQTVNEDCGAQTNVGWATAISAGPANESAQVLTFIVSNNKNGLFSTQPAIAANGTLTYTPAPDSNGMATVSVSLTDDATAGGGALTTAVQTFTITVNPVNDSPVAVADVAFTRKNTPVVINVLTNDTDVDGPSLLIFSVTQGANGTVAINPGNTSVTYSPAADWTGTDTFSYVEVDGAGGVATGTGTVIVATNHNPVAGADSAKTIQNTAVVINVLTNDTDVDGDSLVVTNVTQGVHGSVTMTSLNVTYTPANGWTGGIDTVHYTVADGFGGVATGTVTVTVAAIPTFIVTDPMAGDMLRPGGPLNVAWIGNRVLGAVNVELRKGTNYVLTLTNALPSPATNMTWDTTLTNGVQTGTDYWIYVEDSANTNDWAASAKFTINSGVSLFWQQPTGPVTYWDLNADGTSNSSVSVFSGTTTWQIRGVGDIDGDGIADVIWQAPTGQATCWFMNANGTYHSWTYIYNAATTWQIRGAGDIDGDGIADVIWQAPTGQATCWFMNTNGTCRAWTYIYNAATTWQIRGAGDIDGDGIVDVIWQAPTGQATCWFMNTNGTYHSWAYIYNAPTTWQIRGAGDVDGDGLADVIWQAPTGQATCWFMNTNGTCRAWTYIYNAPTTWQIRGVGF